MSAPVSAPERLTVLPSHRPTQLAKASPCQVGCATLGDVRGWIGIVAQRRRLALDDSEAIVRAWELLAASNPFPATLGRICPHPCESSCTRAGKDQPIAIRALERFLGDWAIDHRLPLPVLESRPTGYSVGVVGSGPAGLSFAYQMARRGHGVTVFERRLEPGGMLRFGVPDYRLPTKVLRAEIGRITDLGVHLVLGREVSDGAALAGLRSDFDAVFIAVGAQVGRTLDIPGEDARGVHTGVGFLAAINQSEDVGLGGHVVVIGGGHTAIDAARSARRRGSKVTVIYRRTRAEMPCTPSEVDEAVGEGVEFRFLETPVEFKVGSGAAHAIVTRRMTLGDPDQSGRRRPVPVSGSEQVVEADAFIVAVAQVPDLGLLGDLATTPHDVGIGEVAPGVWIGGDAVDPSIAGVAIRHGRLVAEVVDARLRGLPDPHTAVPSPISADRIGLYSRPSRARPLERSAPPFAALADPELEVAAGIDEHEFLAEIDRCFSCGLCSGCGQCAMYCTPGVFSSRRPVAIGRYFDIDLEACTTCGKCIDVCPCGYLEPLSTR